jgi:hypothetical protein
MPPIANHGRPAASVAARVGRRRPHRPGAEVVDALLGRGGRRLLLAVARPPDDRPGPEDPPRHRHRQVVLPQVKHVRPGRQGHVRPVVHRQQRAVPTAGGREHLEQRELLARLKPLLPQLHHVYPAAEDRVEEPGQVALGAPPIGAQVEPGVGQPRAQVSHPVIMPHRSDQREAGAVGPKGRVTLRLTTTGALRGAEREANASDRRT